MKTKIKKTREEQITETETKTNQMNTKENSMQEIQMQQSSNAIADTKENQIVLYEQAQNFFQKEYSQATSILSESSSLLLAQMKSNLKVPEGLEDVRKPDLYAQEQARLNAATIAKLMQVQCNFYKAIKQ
jgi:hypothetical protein